MTSSSSSRRPARPARRRAPDPSGGHVAPYVVIAYVVSWGWLLPLVISGSTVVAGTGWPTHFPALAGPLVAAVALTARREGRPGLRDLVRRMVSVRLPVRWWLFAVSPVLLVLCVFALDGLAGRPTPVLSDFAVFSGLPAQWGVLPVAAAVFVVNGFGEETGWRGYALPHLQDRHSPLRATLILAAVWAGWHLPMFWLVDTFRSMGPVMVAGWVLGLGCGAVVLTWLYNRSGGSILLVATWHATYNLISGTRAATGLLAAASTTLVIVLALALVGLEIRGTRRGSPTILGPRPASGGGAAAALSGPGVATVTRDLRP
ncbi:MAG: type II CAAX endopeptidase family protein [Lapillicoccus sp.]